MVVIGDADVLIALYMEEDGHYNEASKTSNYLHTKGYSVIFPDTAIVEAITSFQRKFSSPKLAGILTDQYKKGVFAVEYVDENIMQLAADLFNPKSSKKNTFFDAIVASVAKSLNADAIFSFDNWYRKIGFRLASDL